MTGTEQPAALAAPTSTDSVRVVPDGEWDALVARLGGDDVYLRRGYHVASRALEPGDATPALLHVEDPGGELALPLLLRALPDGSGFDATSAYGYGGPVALGEPDLASIGAAYDAWAAANGVVATFLRFHPLLDNVRLAPPAAEVVQLGATVAWDVSADRGELLPLMHSHHRRAVRKADRAGIEVVVSTNPPELATFRALYDETMRRQEAGAFYFFADAYWDALCADAGGDVVLVEASLDGEVVASLQCFAHGSTLHYHLGASADAARNIGASNRCFLAAAEWAQSRGMTTFHLGGGVGGGTDSPLFQFKHRYDPEGEPRPFAIAKLVHDAARYRELAGTDSTAGFFPPWRSHA
ncbi:MAG: putative GCN5-related N-acetyltransferase [Thermoleophilia bacterium]|nr:putative GCN5-related N-acetyltransferase [Thermoleophilia bacterium]